MTSPPSPNKKLEGKVQYLCDQIRSEYLNLQQGLETYHDAVFAFRASRMRLDIQHKMWLLSYDIHAPEGEAESIDLTGPALSLREMSKEQPCAISKEAKLLREGEAREPVSREKEQGEKVIKKIRTS